MNSSVALDNLRKPEAFIQKLSQDDGVSERQSMEPVRNSILKCLQEFADDDDRIIRKLNSLAEKHGNQTFPAILHILTQLDFSQQDAKNYWQQIIAHQTSMSASLGRKVNLRTVICDYFCSIRKSLKNPKVVEIHVFEATSRSSKYDGLTGLLNRQSFDEALTREMTRAKRYGTELSILFFDLDDFKKLNDSLGHLAGDAALKSVARVIEEEKRAEDTSARYGGEEMTLILPESGKAKAFVLGERIRERVEGMQLDFEGHMINLTLSGGLASFPIDAQKPEKLLQCSDRAMYNAKSTGKNNIALYSHNKRRFMRIDFGGKISIQPLEKRVSKSLSVKGKNLSTTGVLFERSSPLALDSKVKLHIPIESNSKPLSLIGTVVRVEILGKDKFDIGVSFLEMGRSTKSEISRYIKQNLKSLQK